MICILNEITEEARRIKKFALRQLLVPIEIESEVIEEVLFDHGCSRVLEVEDQLAADLHDVGRRDAYPRELLLDPLEVLLVDVEVLLAAADGLQSLGLRLFYYCEAL